MNFLLDTCVISELVSRQPHPGVVEWLHNLDSSRAFLSVLMIGEIQKGIEKLPDSKRKEILRAWLRDELLVRFRGRLVALDVEILMTWGTLAGRLGIQGKPMPPMDSLFAATALHHDFTFVTRNEEDFFRSGVKLFNPWRSA